MAGLPLGAVVGNLGQWTKTRSSNVSTGTSRLAPSHASFLSLLPATTPTPSPTTPQSPLVPALQSPSHRHSILKSTTTTISTTIAT
ncbi:hypothetical protein AMTR_s00053p00126800 [Amborella trichopoda]|uniref:Uncharacterized protein n=1 Tax=Amborella trichopoda TaxID=13333 RepID=W1P598_AMBTC|nr:hypothetical protein AMTR_s00053p00126800 [Amborella trichopoda]